jgi:hypothetical protein
MVAIVTKASDYSKYWDKPWQESQLYAVLEKLSFPSHCHGILAGGAVCRHLLGDDIFKSDIDLFPCTATAHTAIVKHLSEILPTIGVSKYSTNFTLKMGFRETKVQVINKEPAAPAPTILSRFDIEHCKHGVHITVPPIEAQIFYTDLAAIALAKRKIILSNVTNAPYTLARILKYRDKLGFDADHAIKQLTALLIKDGVTTNGDFSLETKAAEVGAFDGLIDATLAMGSS